MTISAQISRTGKVPRVGGRRDRMILFINILRVLHSDGIFKHSIHCNNWIIELGSRYAHLVADSMCESIEECLFPCPCLGCTDYFGYHTVRMLWLLEGHGNDMGWGWNWQLTIAPMQTKAHSGHPLELSRRFRKTEWNKSAEAQKRCSFATSANHGTKLHATHLAS